MMARRSGRPPSLRRRPALPGFHQTQRPHSGGGAATCAGGCPISYQARPSSLVRKAPGAARRSLSGEVKRSRALIYRTFNASSCSEGLALGVGFTLLQSLIHSYSMSPSRILSRSFIRMALICRTFKASIWRRNNYFTEVCSGSETGSYLRLIDFVYHSTLGLRVIKKKKKNRRGPRVRFMFSIASKSS